MNYPNKITIKEWSENDRPREKMLLKGRTALSDAELIAILIGSGNRDESAVDLAKRILMKSQNDLYALGKNSIKELMQFKGVGEAKAISIAAALELGRRRKQKDVIVSSGITSSKLAYEELRSKLEDLHHEEFWVLFLNRKNFPIKIEQVGRGGVSGTVADTKIIFKLAVDCLASGLIIAHNHPSGNLKPSNSDIQLTKKVVEAGKILDIPVLDHLIIGDNAYLSFSDEGLM